MAQATDDHDLDAVRRILARKPNLSHCLEGYSRSFDDHGFPILRLLLEAGADINDRSIGMPLICLLVDCIADRDGSRRDAVPYWGPLGELIEMGADPTLRDEDGRNLLEIAASWGFNNRASLEAYLHLRGIHL